MNKSTFEEEIEKSGKIIYTIARAIYSEAPILLLDEATEKHLLSNLRSMTEKTVLIVTHRPAALDICDKIIRFTENGIEEEK